MSSNGSQVPAPPTRMSGLGKVALSFVALGCALTAAGQLALRAPLVWTGVALTGFGCALLYVLVRGGGISTRRSEAESNDRLEAGEGSDTAGPSRVSSSSKEMEPAEMDLTGESRVTYYEEFGKRYELLEKLGEGQMGELFRARHTRLGRLCAVKSVSMAHMSELLSRRFMREARVTASLLSPHTVHVYDFGKREDGSLFYVMELLDGVDLQSLIRKTGPMPPERVAHLLVQACHSLAEAHGAGLVHRDLKPANLMVCHYGLDEDFLKIVDFGLAKDDSQQDGANLTAQTTVLGTAAYLAPESLRGSANVDGRADLYALGCIAYWMLTAKLVFDHDQPVQMARAHVVEQPPRVKDLVPDLEPEFDQLIFDCLEKAPETRVQTAGDLARRLRTLRFKRPWTHSRARTWWAEYRRT